MNWLHYLVEANLYLAVFYTVYYLFLSNDTHYTLNRAYLLLSCVVSFIIPVIQLGILKHTDSQIATVQHINSNGVAVKLIEVTLVAPPSQFTWQDGVFYSYLAGAAVLLLVLLFKLYQLIRLTRKHNEQADGNYKLVYLNDSNTAFSFFNFLFIGTKADGKETIIKHELVHIHQKHSADIVFIEFLKIINWFNPFIYILQHSLKAIHEYIADEQTAATETDALTYSSFLVHNAYGLSGSSITHSFFNYNLLKKRIIMLNQKRSGNLARLKYLLAVPICGGLLCASTLAFSKNYGWVVLMKQKSDTIAKPPPPPPAPPKVKVTDVRLAPPAGENVKFAAPSSPSEITKKGYKYAESGYLVNGKSDFRVIIVEKDGTQTSYFKSTASTKQIKMLRDKYGYSFPNMSIYSKLPPPPPTPLAPPAKEAPKASIDKRPSPSPPAPVSVQDHKLPLTPPVITPFLGLYKHIAATIRYPKDARKNHMVGNVVASFELNSDHKITNIKIVDGSGNGFDEQVVDALKSYAEVIKNAGDRPYYMMGVSFNLVGDKIDIRAKKFGPDILDTPNYACIVQVNGYTE
ncbi:TonB family protein [Mucilaginibacter sp. X5P1]|uniref:TonB family protein n=1 Tax=Mucilaginibacter sp. X5P1 TaxID=2723088 RepID=UPI0016094E2E|nr:TonB family protein [Mucilaginibacter sp. X5P1]MBB6138168.1 TonB family protein [Mucilaginibacter sp. X5P1]